MIQVQGVSKSFSGHEIFQGISFSLAKKDKVGLLGRNGAGKTTLLKCIMGIESPDQGSVVTPKGYRLGYLAQHISFTHSTVLEEVCAHLPIGEDYASYQAEIILEGLGFSNQDFHRSPTDFSGGYQLRIELAKVMVAKPDAILLDEPTNYLDLPSIQWLEEYFQEWPCEMIVISHDRGFLDSVCNGMVLLHRGSVYQLQGSTHDIYEYVQSIEEVHEKTRQNIEKKKAHLQSFVDRFGAKATKAAQAQSRLKAISRLPSLSKIGGQTSWSLSFPYADYRGKLVFSLDKVTFGYGVKPILRDFSFSLYREEKVACIGQNGVGKSTLLKLLAGFITPLQGAIHIPDGIKTAFFGQGQGFLLDSCATVEEEIQAANPGLDFTQVKQICGLMMFSGDLAKKPIKVLSGGEKSRVQLGRTIASQANFLLLDEPTNHLDLESVEELIQAISDYPGALMIVSHSEHMLRQIPLDRLIVFHDGVPEVFEGNYEEYLTYSDKHFFSVEKKQPAKTQKSKQHVKWENDRKTQSAIRKQEKAIADLEKKKEAVEKKLVDCLYRQDIEQTRSLEEDLRKVETLLDQSYEKLESLEDELGS